MSLLARFRQYDATLARRLMSRRVPPLNAVMVIAAHSGDFGGVWVAASLALMYGKTWRERGVRLLFCFLLTCFINNLALKNIVARDRPSKTLPWITTLITPPRDYSFPSGHTASAFASAFALWRAFGWRVGAPASVVAAAIGFSRAYTGAHYVGDVAAGVFTGIICGALGWNVSGGKYDAIAERINAWR